MSRAARTPPAVRPPSQPSPPASVAVVLLGVELLLVTFSIGAALLDQSALAVMAGTAAITLAGEIVRRFLTSPAERPDVDARDDRRAEADEWSGPG